MRTFRSRICVSVTLFTAVMATVTGLEPPQHVVVDTVELLQLQAKEKEKDKDDGGQLVSRSYVHVLKKAI